MSGRSTEAGLLARAEAIVSDHVSRFSVALGQEARFQLLEGVASRLGGFELPAFQKRFGRLLSAYQVAGARVIPMLIFSKHRNLRF